jgi:long-chain acyl-CoA synthetase
LYTWLARGSRLALARSHHTIIDDCKRFAPTLINGVPYFFERVRQKLIEAGVADEPDKLREVLGGKIRGCCSGGAALPIETFDFFESRGVPLLQGYGLTESSPVISLSTLDIRKRGTAGRPLNSVEVSITDDGEILTRGPHVMLGYWQDDAATHEVIRDGWLHTGDLGAIDDEGYLCITGRKKEIIVTTTGKNIFPTHIESLLCRDPFILQALVIGNNRKYLTALIVPDPDVLKVEIRSRRLFVFRRKTAVSHPKILALYRQRIDRQLADQSRHEQICRFRVLDHGFTPNNGYLTPKLSLRRELILRDFADEIESLYE